MGIMCVCACVIFIVSVAGRHPPIYYTDTTTTMIFSMVFLIVLCPVCRGRIIAGIIHTLKQLPAFLIQFFLSVMVAVEVGLHSNACIYYVEDDAKINLR